MSQLLPIHVTRKNHRGEIAQWKVSTATFNVTFRLVQLSLLTWIRAVGAVVFKLTGAL